MPFALNDSGRVAALRRADRVQIDVHMDALGIDEVRLQLEDRTEEYHCLVSLPPMPSVTHTQQGSVRLHMRATYESADGARKPFYVYVVGFAGGKQISEERTRFFAGTDEARLVLDIALPSETNLYQIVFYADRTYHGCLTLRDLRLVAGDNEYGVGPGEHMARPISRARHWWQNGRRVICTTVFGEHWAEMPNGWSLDAVHPAALAAADWLLYSRAFETAFGTVEPMPDPGEAAGRPSGTRTLLSYSLGTDSTAALSLLPEDTLLYYCERPYTEYLTRAGASVSLPDPAPWDERLQRMVNLFVIPTTFEQIGIAAGGRHGFTHPFGYAAIGLLLADHVDAGVLAFGSVMEQVFLRSGNLYSDVVALPSSSYNRLRGLIESAGLFFALPTGGCSEVLTARISEQGRLPGVAISCPSPSRDGSACGTCFKCFRKLRISGDTNVPEPSESVLHELEKYPLKSATSVVYAAQRSGFQHPALDRYRDLDLGLLERYYGYAVDRMLPPGLGDHVRGQLQLLGVEPMTEADEQRLRTIGQVFWPEKFSWTQAGLRDPFGS
jgi:hypothetical protein